MNDLVSLIIEDRDSKIRAEEFAKSFANLKEIEVNSLKSNFEEALMSFSETDKRKCRDYFNGIIERGKVIKTGEQVTPLTSNNNNGTSQLNSAFNSPEKQASSTRWSIPREERKRILELMERGREEQKRRKKKNWCKLDLDEFEELWKMTDKLTEKDLEIMEINEGIQKVDEKPCLNTKANKRVKTDDIQSPNEPILTIVDFDCIEDLLVQLSGSKNTSISDSAKFLLDTANEIYRSDLTFYMDLKEFDQPYFDFYREEDDEAGLKNYRFESDDLGRFCRGKSFNDKTKKFYRERAYRFRYMSRKPYDLFFSSKETFKKLKEHVENLKRNSKDFDFWISSVIAKRNVCFISHRPLMKAFSIFLVISRTVALSTAEITELLWSCRKMGPRWTLEEILRLRMRAKSTAGLLTRNVNSEIAREATKFKDLIKIL